MTDGLNEEIRQAFAKLTRVPRPHLSERIRESIWGRPAPGTRLAPGVPAWVGPGVSSPRAGRRAAPRRVLVAAVLVIALAAVPLLVGPAGVAQRLSAVRQVFSSHRPAATAAAGPASAPVAPQISPAVSASPASPEPTPAPAASPPPAETPAPAPAALPGYSCSAQTGGGGAQSTMTAARVGAQSGFDRFVVEFSGGVPQFEVRLQDSAAFGQGTLRGSAGLAVTLRNLTGTVYAGQREFRPGLTVIQEARLLSDSGGTAQWGVGLAYASCFHAWILGGPSRLVIDVQH